MVAPVSVRDCYNEASKMARHAGSLNSDTSSVNEKSGYSNINRFKFRIIGKIVDKFRRMSYSAFCKKARVGVNLWKNCSIDPEMKKTIWPKIKNSVIVVARFSAMRTVVVSISKDSTLVMWLLSLFIMTNCSWFFSKTFSGYGGDNYQFLTLIEVSGAVVGLISVFIIQGFFKGFKIAVFSQVSIIMFVVIFGSVMPCIALFVNAPHSQHYYGYLFYFLFGLGFALSSLVVIVTVMTMIINLFVRKMRMKHPDMYVTWFFLRVLDESAKMENWGSVSHRANIIKYLEIVARIVNNSLFRSLKVEDASIGVIKGFGHERPQARTIGENVRHFPALGTDG